MSTDSELTGIMNAQLPTNGTGDIDAVEHRTMVAALIASKASREDDASKLGLKELDETRSYAVGEGFMLGNSIWQSVNGHSPGETPSSPGTATFFQLTKPPTIDNFVKWDSGTTYIIGDTIQRNFKLYESLTNENLNNDPSTEIPLVNWIEVSASGNIWGEDYVTDTLYEKKQVVWRTVEKKFYWLNSPTATYLSTDFTAELAAGIWEQIISANVTGKLYVRNLGDIYLTPTYLDSLYASDFPGQKTISDYQVAERTTTGWLISNIQEITTGWANYRDTRYTVGSPFSVIDGVPVVLPINTANNVDSQKPLDINTFFYSAKLTLDDASVFAIGDTLTGVTSTATGDISDIIGNVVFMINISDTPFQASEVVDAQDAATANTTAIDLDSAITGRNGDCIGLTIEFKVKPDGAGTDPRIKISIFIGGSVGEIFLEEQSLTKGSGVEHYFLSGFSAYNLDTWEANGGKVMIEGINEDLLIYDIRILITRTHKAR